MQVKNFDDLKRETSMLLTQSYLRKGGMYQNQLIQQQQQEQQNRIAQEQQRKLIEEKEQIVLDVSRPIQANDEIYQVISTFKNSDSAEKNSGITNIFQNRRIMQSFSIISPKPLTPQDTLTNLQINGDASLKSQSQSPYPTLDMEFDKKKVLTEQYVVESDDNQIETYGSLDNHMNMLEKSKPINGGISVQTAYFKNKNSMSINNPNSGYFASNGNIKPEIVINQVSRFGGMNPQINKHLSKSEVDVMGEDYDTDFQERGEETSRKTEITKYQFQTVQPHLSEKREEIFKPQGKKLSNNTSFSNNLNHQANITPNRFPSSEQLVSTKRGQQTLNQNNATLNNNNHSTTKTTHNNQNSNNNNNNNIISQNPNNTHQNCQNQTSKVFSDDLTSSHAKHNQKENQQNSQQFAPYSFMQSHGIHDTSHNSTSDVLSQQQANENILHLNLKPVNSKHDGSNNQQDFVIILSNASIDSQSPQQDSNKKKEPSEENLLETNGSLEDNINLLEKTVNGAQSINTSFSKNKRSLNFTTQNTQNTQNNPNNNRRASSPYNKGISLNQMKQSDSQCFDQMARFNLNPPSNLVVSAELDETVENIQIVKYHFEVTSPHLSQKREQIFNPSSKKGSTNTSFSSNQNSIHSFQNGANPMSNSNKILSPNDIKDMSSSKKLQSAPPQSPSQNLLSYIQTKEQLDNLISNQQQQQQQRGLSSTSYQQQAQPFDQNQRSSWQYNNNSNFNNNNNLSNLSNLQNTNKNQSLLNHHQYSHSSSSNNNNCNNTNHITHQNYRLCSIQSLGNQDTSHNSMSYSQSQQLQQQKQNQMHRIQQND